MIFLSGAKFSYCIKCIQVLEADDEVCKGTGVYAARSSSGSCWCLNIVKLMSTKEQLIAKEQIKVLG